MCGFYSANWDGGTQQDPYPQNVVPFPLVRVSAHWIGFQAWLKMCTASSSVLRNNMNLKNASFIFCPEYRVDDAFIYIRLADLCQASNHWMKELLQIQYIPRNMHTVFALLCFVVVIHWLIFPYPSGLLHWHCGNLTIAPVPAKQPWWIWINTSCEFIMNDCITTTKQSTTKPCAYFLGHTVPVLSCGVTWMEWTI